MSLGDRDSYYDDLRQITYPKDKKAKQEIPTPMTCLHYLKIVQKIIPYDGAVVGQKRPITKLMVVITLQQKLRVVRVRS